jgi:hypothetical protein
LLVTILVVLPGVSSAQSSCSRVVIFTLPGVTWSEVQRVGPPNLLDIVDRGAIASMSVRTNSSRTSYASGFATMGAGTRMEGGVTTGGQIGPDRPGLATDVQAAGVQELRDIADEDGYDAVPGALAEALDPIPTYAIGNAEPATDPTVVGGFERWSLLAAMDPQGMVDGAAVGPDLLSDQEPSRTNPEALELAITEALGVECGLVVIDQGDLIRTELAAGSEGPSNSERATALLSADRSLGHVSARLAERDLLVVVAPTSPLYGPVRFGITVVSGPGFPAGSMLSSASTRRDGIVTLPDLAPTILEHLDVPRHPAMLGRPFFSTDEERDRIAVAIDDDAEAVFVDEVRTPVTTTFVVVQVAVYLLIAWILYRRERGGRGATGRWLEAAALAIVAFPMCTYLAGVVSQHELGEWGFYGLLLAADVVVIAIVNVAFRRPLDRLLALTAATCGVLMVDVVTGGSLQVNTVFSYSPLVAGRFAGFGNTAFSVLGAAAIVTCSLLVHRAGGSRGSLIGAAGLFAAVIVVDGAPAWGSDVGGVLAFVPAFAITMLLLAGRRPTWKVLGLCVLGAGAVLGLFLAFDLSRSADDRTHLARLFEDVRTRGWSAFSDTIGRKVSTNLRVFTSTIWTYFVPPALGFIAWLLLRPRNRWERLAVEYPTLRAGLIGGLVLCILGFALNDSGIVVPAMVLSYLVPVALLAHLSMEKAGTE